MADNFFDEKDIVEDENFFDEQDVVAEKTEITEPESPEISQLETAAKSAVQGATMGFGEELGAAALAPLAKALETVRERIPGTPEATDRELREQGFTGSGVDKQNLIEKYKELRDVARESNIAAAEANPKTALAAEIAGGILPGIATGGGAAAANILKTGTAQALKEGAKVGAKFGAAEALGRSEADLTEGEVVEAAKDVAVGTGLGAIGGGVLPLAGKGVKEAAKIVAKPAQAVGDKAVKAAKIIPAVKEGIESYKLAKAGKSVLGEENYQKVIDESKQAVKDQLKPLLLSENSKFGNAIGKIMKRVDNIGDTKDISKQLGSIRKQINNLKETGKAPTEESRKVLDELENVIGMYQKESVKITPSKSVKTGVEKALRQVQERQNKITANAKEAGETVNFTEPRVDLETGTVTIFETTTGKPITANIKSGEFTPVKYRTQTETQDYDVNKLRALKDSAFELLEKAKTNKLGVSKKPIAKTFGLAKESIEELAEQSQLKGALTEANVGFGRVQEIAKTLPADILETKDPNAINKVAQFLRKADIEGISGDDLRDRLATFSDELKQLNPEFAEKFIPRINDIAKRYDLARTARQSFGTSLTGTAKATGVITGSLAGSAARKVTSPVTKALGKLDKLSVNQVNNLASQLTSSNKPGLQHFGQRLNEAMAQEGTARSQLLFSLGQSPAFREMLKKQLPEMDEDLQQASGINIQSNVDQNTQPQQSTEFSEENTREPSSVSSVDEALEFITSGAIEGGFQKQEADTGNYINGKLIGTNHGVTPKAYKEFYGKVPTEADMRNLTKEEAKQIYKKDYVEKPGFDKIQDPNLQTSLVDFGINSGPKQAVKTLQRLIGTKADGIIGPQTLSKISEYSGNLTADLNEARREFLNKLDEEKYGMYKKGWNNRIDKLDEFVAPEVGEPTALGEIDTEIDRVNQQQSSGDSTPINQLDSLLEKINNLKNVNPEDIDTLENEAVNMATYSDGERLKELLRQITKLS